MSNPLAEIYDILDDFENDLSTKRAIWKKLEIDNPYFELLSEENWEEKHARMWLHGATKVAECSELERWLFDNPPLTAVAQIPASKIRIAWKKWLQTKNSCGAYYADFLKFKIPVPKKDELLIHFIIRLAQSLENGGKGHPLEWRALKSFLDFIRVSYPVEEVAFIEQIFPKKMKMHFGKIIRIISPEAYPIPEKTASEIMMELAYRCRNGRPDARLTAAESLGLCWLCMTASRIRLPKYLETIKEIKPAAVQLGADFPLLQVPTWFGNRPANISDRVSRFFNALARIPSKKPRETILQRPLRSLSRMLEEVLQSVSPNPEYGNITYVSLLNQPHIFGDCRMQPKYLANN